jgi:hypothetical protein
MDVATKKLMNHSIWHLSRHQLNMRTAADWNEIESAKHILRSLRDHGDLRFESQAFRVVDYAFPDSKITA